MSGRARRHPLQSASSSMWALGILYLLVGLMVFVVEAFRQPSPGEFARASVWVLPGAAYLFAASFARPGRRWTLAIGFVCTAVVTLGLILLLAWVVLYVGPWRLAAWRVPMASEVALLLALLIVYQSYLIHHLIGAWRAVGDDLNAIGRGFAVRPMPVRVIDPEGAVGADAERVI